MASSSHSLHGSLFVSADSLPCMYKVSRVKSDNDLISVFLAWLNLKFSEIFKLYTKVWYNNRVCKKEG